MIVTIVVLGEPIMACGGIELMCVISTVKSCSPSSSSSSVILKSMQLVVGPPTKNVVLTKPRGLKSPTAEGKLNQEILIT